MIPPPALSQPLPLAAQGLQAEVATPYSDSLCRLLSDELVPFPLEPRYTFNCSIFLLINRLSKGPKQRKGHIATALDLS